MVLVGSWGRRVAEVAGAGLVFLLVVFGPGMAGVAQALEFGEISGTVTDSNGDPVPGVRVGILALATGFFPTNANGQYTIFSVPHSAGPYDVQLLAPCTRDQVKRVLVDGNETVNFTIAAQDKRAGYTCAATSTPYEDPQGIRSDPSNNDEDVAHFSTMGSTLVFPYSGFSTHDFYVSTNGWLIPIDPDKPLVEPAAAPVNGVLPDSAAPNAIIAPFWDDLVVDDAAYIEFAIDDTAPADHFLVEWNNVLIAGTTHRLSFEALLYETGRIVFQYSGISSATTSQRERGTSATVGIENPDGTAAVQRSFNQPYLTSGMGIEFVPASK